MPECRLLRSLVFERTVLRPPLLHSSIDSGVSGPILALTNTLNSSSSAEIPPLQVSQAGKVISLGRGGMKRFFGGTWSSVVATAPQKTQVFGALRNCSRVLART